jgi:hypothetical protein
MSLATKIQYRRGLAADWTTANPVLGAGELGFETDTRKYKIGDGTTAWATLAYIVTGLQQADYDSILPWTIEITPQAVFDAPLRTGNWALVQEPNDLNIFVILNNSPTQNDEIGWDFIMAAGTWNLNMTFMKIANGAIATVNLDGAAVGTIDTYNSATTHNNHATVTGFAVPTNAKHRVSLKMATKNASSTGFELLMCGFQLRRTA